MNAFRYLLGLVACAFAMGTVFDVYNTATGSTKWLRWLRPLLDVSFWLLSACVVYYVAFITDNGRLRVYTFVLLLLGYLLYRTLFHRAVVRSAHRVILIVRATVLLCLKILRALVWLPLRLLARLVWLVLRGLYRVGVSLENGLATVLAWCLRIIAFPLRRLWPHDVRWQTNLRTAWEDFWTWLSNRIANPSGRA